MSPTKEQVKYLDSIGIAEEALFATKKTATAGITREPSKTPDVNGSVARTELHQVSRELSQNTKFLDVVRVVLAIFALMLFIFFVLSQTAHGQEIQYIQPNAQTSEGAQKDKEEVCLASVEAELQKLQERVCAIRQFCQLERQNVQARMLEIKEFFKKSVPQRFNEISNRIKVLSETDFESEKTKAVIDLLKSLYKILGSKCDGLVGIAEESSKNVATSNQELEFVASNLNQLLLDVRIVRKKLERENSMQRRTLWAESPYSMLLLESFLMFFVAVFIMTFTLHASFRKWLERLESNVLKHSQPKPVYSTEQEPPGKFIEQLVANAGRYPHLAHKPQVPAGAWNLGVATAKGNVRQENQDYAVAFEIGEYQVAILADGCGGTPHGRLASSIAVGGAVNFVISNLGTVVDSSDPNLSKMALETLRAAYVALGTKGAELGISKSMDGLRTTFIVIIANAQEVGFAYIGDGSGQIVRASGETLNFLVPQKADPAYQNVLSGSLGPVMEGKPVMGSLSRQSGDFLIATTDGLADYAENSFPKEFLKRAIQSKGDLQGVSEEVVNFLTEQKNEAGEYVYDDNMSVVLMGTKAQPKLGKGFWNHSGDSNTNQ